ncbi:MAG: right-handed parallel beta-helix repeat-containing protein [Thermoplasmata archaeon]
MMKKTISIGLVSLFAIGGFLGLFSLTTEVNASGPTYVSGSITIDTSWNSIDSPFIVIGDLTVESGATLTIEPGVVVKFDGLNSIIVDGKLIVNGNFQNKIKFTSNQSSPAKGDWYTIRLRTKDNLINHAEIEYATYGIFMTFFSANNTISNVTTKFCKVDGIYITNSDHNQISYSTASFNDRYGITIYQSNGTKINNCIIQNNKYFGINLNASTYSEIQNSNISYNDGKGIRLYSNAHHTTIVNTSFFNNNNIGIDLSGTSNNIFKNTKVIANNGIGIDFGGKSTNQRIENSIIMNNNGTGIDLKGSSYIDIIDSNVSNNWGKGGIYSGSVVDNVTIINTDIWNNRAGNGIDLHGATFVNITNSNINGNNGSGIHFGIGISNNNTINNCEIIGNFEDGIHFNARPDVYSDSFANGNNIFNSVIHSNGKNGIHFQIDGRNIRFPGQQITTANYNSISTNFIYNNGENGIYFFMEGSPLVNYNLIYDNLIYSNNQSGVFFNFDSALKSGARLSYNSIYNNNIYLNKQHGIYYQNENGVVYKNNIFRNIIQSNRGNGIFFNSGDYGGSVGSITKNAIYDNHISTNNQNGISFYIYEPRPVTNILHNLISNNSITSNNLSGIKLHITDYWNKDRVEIKNITITGNYISYNHNDGIYIISFSNVSVRYNDISNNIWSGINLISSSNNTFENNHINSSDKNGILFTNSSQYNTIYHNEFSNNTETGLYILSSSGSTIHHNNFKNNAQNAYDSTIFLNDWDDGLEGNSWSDYTGMDDNNDGFGEDPYLIPGGGSRDWHPYMYFLDISAPQIIFTSPGDASNNIPINSTISITFTKEMNTSSVESALSLSSNIKPQGFNWDEKNKTVLFSTSSVLEPGTTYTVTITIDAKDALGNSIKETYIFSFTSIKDDDNDGYPNSEDDFPEDPNEWLDTDNDTIGNNADTDDDNDGIDDKIDSHPTDPNKWTGQFNISIAHITLSKYTILEGEEVTVYAVIENSGNNDCEAFVRFYDGDPESGGTLITLGQEIVIVSRNTFIISVKWSPTRGNHTIFAVAESQTTGEKSVAQLSLEVGENLPTGLVLSTGDINIFRFEPGQERTISVEVTCYLQTVTNVHLVVLDDQNLTIDATITPPRTMNDGETIKFYLRIKAPELPDGVEKLEKDIVIQVVGDNGVFSNAEELDIVVSESAVSFLNPMTIAGAVVTGSLATLGAAAAASRRNENWKYLLLLTFAMPLYSRIHGKKTLDNFVRGQVYGHIQSQPGTHFNEIRKTLKLGNGNLAYHLRKLEKEGFIISKRDKRYRRFYPVGVEVPEEDGIKLSKTQENILYFIERHPQANQKEIAKELKESQQTISYNINVLVREGFLKEEKIKGTKIYEIFKENT